MLRVLRFWLDRGIDGLRLDAVPYLFEREGTNCENLPETHLYLKQMRAEIDRDYSDRMLLAEANQWPPDVRPYFGDGDEFHMAFHFPLMPRIYMALRKEVRTPIVDILAQTPDIPENCQWGFFLRNHDELTLEMVTDDERDYMYTEYARDPRMRINIGIRRRLAPLIDNGRRRQELLHSLLFSMPGTPSSTTATRSAWATTSIWAIATACARRCSGRGPQRRLLVGRPAGALPTAGDRPRLSLPGDQRRTAASPPAAELDAAADRRPQALPGLRPRHDRVPAPANLAVLAYLRCYGDQTCWSSTTFRASSNPSSSTCAHTRAGTRRAFGETVFPGRGSAVFLSLGPHTFYWFRLTSGGSRRLTRGGVVSVAYSASGSHMVAPAHTCRPAPPPTSGRLLARGHGSITAPPYTAAR